jgi:hypothetical protein
MTDAGFEMSNQAVAVLFGSGGFLSGVVALWLSKGKVKVPSVEECRRANDDNKREHKDLDVRVKALELARATSDEVNRGIRRELKSMNNKLNRLLGMPADEGVEGDA